MFEGNMPPNLPTVGEKVEDIFAPVEPVKSMPSESGVPDKPAPRETPRTGFKRLLIIVVGVVVLSGVVWAGYFGFQNTRQAAKIKPASKVTAPTVAPLTAPSPEVIPPPETVPAPAEIPAEVQPLPVDTDGDGLTDEEEAALGTNAQSADSDNDTLSDREEVKVYKSNPLNQDTDGDSYLDGHEVKNNYNPTGSGKLLPPVPLQ